MTMQLDNHRIAIRERSQPEVLDLALRVFRVSAWPLLPLLGTGIVPMMFLNQWLLADVIALDLEPQSLAQYALLMLVLVFWEAPLATAPATLYLGQSAFSRRPELRAVAADFFKSLGQLLLFQGVLRLWFAPWLFLNEVILLDRNPIWGKAGSMTTLRRARALHRGEGAEVLARLLVWTGAGLALLASVWFSIYSLRSVLLNEREFDRTMYTLHFPLALWLVVGYFTVVRFLSYLDLRIRREGWEVELAMRAEQARLTRQWE